MGALGDLGVGDLGRPRVRGVAWGGAKAELLAATQGVVPRGTPVSVRSWSARVGSRRSLHERGDKPAGDAPAFCED